MKLPVKNIPFQAMQPSTPSALIVNEGPGTLYMDTQSSVSKNAYSLSCVPGQSVNWSGGELWFVSDTACYVTVMHGGNTTIAPVSNVTIDQPVEISGVVAVAGNVGITGPVAISGTVPITGDVGIDGPVTVNGDVNVNGTVPITGDVGITGPVAISGTVPITGDVGIDGPVTVTGDVNVNGTVPITGDVGITGPVAISGVVNVGTVTGNVNVDGSTVNIGNNVRIWGGGEYVGTYNWTGVNTSATLAINLMTQFPQLSTNKYLGVYMVVNAIYTGGAPTTDGFYGTGFVGQSATGNTCLDWTPLATYEISTAITGNSRRGSMYTTIVNTATLYAGMTFERFGGGPYTITLDVYGTYGQLYQEWPETTSGVFAANGGTPQWINMSFDYPLRLSLVLGPGSTQNGNIARSVVSTGLGLRALMGTYAANLTADVPLNIDIYPSYRLHEQVRFNSGANAGTIRYTITPLERR